MIKINTPEEVKKTLNIPLPKENKTLINEIKPKKKYHYTKKTGSPTKYKPEYCQAIIRFFSVKHFKVVRKKQIANPIPYLKDFAWRICKVDYVTVNGWSKDYPEFGYAYTIAKSLQETMFVSNSLKGLYDSRFAIFAAKNMFGWVDKTEIDHGVTDELLEKFKDKPTHDLITESARLAREVIALGGDSNSSPQKALP